MPFCLQMYPVQDINILISAFLGVKKGTLRMGVPLGADNPLDDPPEERSYSAELGGWLQGTRLPSRHPHAQLHLAHNCFLYSAARKPEVRG